MVADQPNKQLPVRSPCIGVCQLDDQQLCIACHRHIDEIAQWSGLNRVQRLEVLDRIKERRRS